MPYQINSSQLFLTYPQCDVDKQTAYDYLINKFKPTEILVAHELHASGDDHLHCYLRLPAALYTRDPKFADLPTGHHGNYQGCRSAKNVLKYCTKSDDFVSSFDVGPRLERKSVRKLVTEQLIGGKRPLHELVNEFPEYLIGYTRLKLDLTNYLKDKEDERTVLPVWLPNPWGLVLPSCILSKCRHYWIFSILPSVGKTYLFGIPLFKQYRCYIRTGNEPYWNLRGDEQCIILDEYNAALFKYHELNSMADGTFSYRIFMGGVIQLKNPLIIILSNQDIISIYPNMYNLLYARFKQIEVK